MASSGNMERAKGSLDIVVQLWATGSGTVTSMNSGKSLMTSRNSDSRERESNGISCQIFLPSIFSKLPGIGEAERREETLNNLSEIAIYLV